MPKHFKLDFSKKKKNKMAYTGNYSVGRIVIFKARGIIAIFLQNVK